MLANVIFVCWHARRTSLTVGVKVMVVEVSAYDPAAYGNRLGSDYDTLYPAADLETEEAVALLSEYALARPGRSFVEFGIGTGRLALPLQERSCSATT